MNEINLSRIDLNLLVVFEAVARHKSVTLAAQQLALSQSAISHALKRLRHVVNDELFLRSKHGLVLTARAEALLVPVQTILQAITEVLHPAEFEPKTSTKTFRIAASDYAIATIVPKLVTALREQAPATTLELESFGQHTFARLTHGELDGSFLGVAAPTGFQSLSLFTEQLLGVVAQTHPLASKVAQNGITLDDYLAFPHLTVSFKDPTPSALDAELAKLGYQRQIVVASPNLLANVALLNNTDLIMSAPSRLVRYAQSRELCVFDLPFAMPSYTYSFVWHQRLHNDPALQWFKQTLLTVLD